MRVAVQSDSLKTKLGGRLEKLWLAIADCDAISRAILTGHPKMAMRQVIWAQRLRQPATAYRLHLGCGQKRIPGFVNIDHNASAATDYVCDITKLPCASGQCRTYRGLPRY